MVQIHLHSFIFRYIQMYLKNYITKEARGRNKIQFSIYFYPWHSRSLGHFSFYNTKYKPLLLSSVVLQRLFLAFCTPPQLINYLVEPYLRCHSINLFKRQKVSKEVVYLSMLFLECSKLIQFIALRSRVVTPNLSLGWLGGTIILLRGVLKVEQRRVTNFVLTPLRKAQQKLW